MYCSEVGIDTRNKLWFKSDQFLTEITQSYDFYVSSWRDYIFFGKRRWYLNARIDPSQNQKREVDKVYTKTIGIYDTSEAASKALEKVMDIKGIKNYWLQDKV